MKLCRFNEGRLGLVEGAFVRDVTSALDVLPPYRYPLPSYDVLIANLRHVIAAIPAQSPKLPLASVKLLSPVANPGKIIAAPVNYQKHIEEVKADSQLHQNNPAHTITIHKAGLFLKATSSLVGPGEGIALRHLDRRNDHEVELALVIGKTSNNVPASEALQYVAGYCDRPRHHNPRHGRPQLSQVAGQLHGPRPMACHGGRDSATPAISI